MNLRKILDGTRLRACPFLCIIFVQHKEGTRHFGPCRVFKAIKKRKHQLPSLWCGQRDLNPYGHPPDPKSGASANSAMSACIDTNIMIRSQKGFVNLETRNSFYYQSALFANLTYPKPCALLSPNLVFVRLAPP